MNLIGRYQGVRGWNGKTLTAPYIIDRKWSRLIPAGGNEWWRTPDGTWIPTISGGAVGWQGKHRTVRIMWPAPQQTLTLNTLALSSNYVAGTGGSAMSGRIFWPAALTINSIYFFISSYTGTAASVTDIDWSVRSGAANSVTTSAGGLLASGTVNPSSATGWIAAATSQTISLTTSTYYYVIIGDANGNGTNFANVNLRTTGFPVLGSNAWPDYLAISTANGFIAQSTNTGCPGIVTVLSDGTTYGMPYTADVAPTNATNRKGYYISNGTYAPLTIFGIVAQTATNNISGAEVYFGATTTPGTSPATTSTNVIKDGSANVIGVLFSPSQVLPSYIPIRVVFTYSSNATSPHKLSIGTGANADLRSAGFGGGNIYFAEANGTTNWANDDTNSLPLAALLVDDQVTGPIVMVNE